MAGTLLFYYFGDDEAYYKALQTEFSKQTRLAIEFKKMFETEEIKIQTLFREVAKKTPNVVFVDFSSHSQDYLHLARLLTRTPFDTEITTVGLLDYLSPTEVLLESIATGVELSYIKSTDLNDLIFDVAKLIAPAELSDHGFAKAPLKEEWEGGIPVKIGFATATSVHFETDFPLQKGDRIRLNHPWIEKQIVPSKDCFVKEVSSKNLFYHFNFAVDADFLFMDEFLPPTEMDDSAIDLKRRERDHHVEHHKNKMHKWIEQNLSTSQEKKSKILVVDRDFQFYNDQPRTDRHPFTIRCVSFLEDVSKELDRFEPQVIVFALEKADAPNRKNNIEALAQLVAAAKYKFKDHPPFIVVFNSKTPSKDLQEEFAFAHIMTSESELSVEVLLKMAAIFEKKLLAQTQQIQGKADEKKVFLKKSDIKSLAEIVVPLTIVKISETDIIFQSSVNFLPGTNIHLKTPVDMFINVQTSKNSNSKVPEFQGLIHAIGESEKKELRRYVNTVFFREHDAKAEAVMDEFKKLNDTKLQEKQDAIQAQLAADSVKKEEDPA